MVVSNLQAITNLLESRFLDGDKNMIVDIKQLLEKKNLWDGDSFFLAKLQEQIKRHSRFDNTEYNLEPNIKSSPGGLRDIHTINWLFLNYSRKNHEIENFKKVMTSSESRELNKNKLWIWTLRYLLHKEAGREEDRLLFDFQVSIAKKLFPDMTDSNEAAEKLMHRYFKSALNISEINSTVIQSFREKMTQPKRSLTKIVDKNFQVRNNLIEFRDPSVITKKPSLILEIFVKLCENPGFKGIRSDTLRILKENRQLIDSNFRKKKKNIDLFMKLLRSERLMVTQLEQMKQLGILGRYLPEFGKVTGQMQYDLFHIYTVDAHTLQVLRNMRRLFLGTSKKLFPLASKIVHLLPKLELLYISGLFHDIGKGRRKDHSKVGALSVYRFCKNHRLSLKDTELVKWLVDNHLKMSITSQKEDLTNRNVIRSFAELVKDENRLNYLYCLTVADIAATNPSLWNTWNASLLEELFSKTLNYFNFKHIFNTDLQKESLNILNQLPSGSQQKIKSLWRNFYSSYFENQEPEITVKHGLLIVDRKLESLAKFVSKKDSKLTNSLLVYTKDRKNVFATIVGILDSQNICVLDAQLYGTKDGFCLDNIVVSDDKGAPLEKDSPKLKRIESNMIKELEKKTLTPKFAQKRLPIHFKTFKKKTVIEVNHDMTNRWTQIDIKTADRPGLLSSVCQAFVKNNASIKKARISTYGERAEDRFCISSSQETPFLKRMELNKLLSDLKIALDGKSD